MAFLLSSLWRNDDELLPLPDLLLRLEDALRAEVLLLLRVEEVLLLDVLELDLVVRSSSLKEKSTEKFSYTKLSVLASLLLT